MNRGEFFWSASTDQRAMQNIIKSNILKPSAAHGVRGTVKAEKVFGFWGGRTCQHQSANQKKNNQSSVPVGSTSAHAGGADPATVMPRSRASERSCNWWHKTCGQVSIRDAIGSKAPISPQQARARRKKEKKKKEKGKKGANGTSHRTCEGVALSGETRAEKQYKFK